MALAVKFDLIVEQIDAKSAFLQCDLDEQIYVYCQLPFQICMKREEAIFNIGGKFPGAS